ncbi:hypothetical protein BH24ACT18_BH24ACT18_11960 [soil metagenome]
MEGEPPALILGYAVDPKGLRADKARPIPPQSGLQATGFGYQEGLPGQTVVANGKPSGEVDQYL